MKEIEEIYLKETGDKPTYRKDSSDYHTLKYVHWLESRFADLQVRVVELERINNNIINFVMRMQENILPVWSRLRSWNQEKNTDY